MNVVPRRRTPITASEATRLLRDTFETLGVPTSKNELGSLLALIWIETARGNSVNNHNFGNISASERFTGDAFRPPWFDFDGGTADTPRNRELHELMLKNQVPSAFRAYPSPEAGMRDFLSQIRSSFPEVMRAANTADPEAFRVALSKKYSKDYENPKATSTFRSLFQEFGLSPKAKRGEPETCSSPWLWVSGRFFSEKGDAST